MPTTWILGNWKQNHLRADAERVAAAISSALPKLLDAPTPGGNDLEVGIAPTYVALAAAAPHCEPHSRLHLLAQDCAAQDSGAYTGEIGPVMLKDAGAQGAIVGHSERRGYYGEDDALVGSKLQAALAGGLRAVLCIGESLEQRDAGEAEKTVISQLSGALSKVDSSLIGPQLVIAYEPVWAIGTGRTATPEQASEMHRTIRRWMREAHGDNGADRSVLYGGSVKPANAAELIAAGDIDGFLVGGASLDPESFLAIVHAAAQTARPPTS